MIHEYGGQSFDDAFELGKELYCRSINNEELITNNNCKYTDCKYTSASTIEDNAVRIISKEKYCLCNKNGNIMSNIGNCVFTEEMSKYCGMTLYMTQTLKIGGIPYYILSLSPNNGELQYLWCDLFFDKDANDIYYKDTEVNDANITVEDIHKMSNVRDINKMIINF